MGRFDSQYSVAPADDLRSLCIRKNWFTMGCCEQYMRMFDMNKEKRPLEEIAVAIWLCSTDVSRDEVQKELESLHENYLMMLGEMQQAQGERDADEVYCGQFD